MVRLVDVINEAVDRRESRQPKKTAHGEVLSITSSLAMVRISGSARGQPAKIPAGMVVSGGDDVTLILNDNNPSIRWVISEVTSKGSFIQPVGTGQSYTELYPPANVRVLDVIAGCVTVAWDSPANLQGVFEVETGDGVDAGTKVFQTSGSYAIIATSSSINIRVRLLAPDGQTSPYSPWVVGNPAIQTRSGNYIQIPFAYDSSPTTIPLITALDGSFVTQVIVEITTAFNGSAPTLRIGEAGTLDRLMTTSENDLKIVGAYNTQPLYEYPGTTNVVATLVPSTASQGAGIITLIF